MAPTALITGASSGIGAELARRFAQEGYALVLVARSAERLQGVADELRRAHGVSVQVLPLDLSDPSTPEAITAALRREGIALDVLVNNAGFGTHGLFATSDWAAESGMIRVNMVALTHLTRLVLPGMVQRRSGKILNVASLAAFQPGPLMAVYYASKAYVLSFSEALAEELRGSGVTVTALCPGYVPTGFQTRAGIQHAPSGTISEILDARTVAEVGYRGVMRGDPVVIPGFRNQLSVLAVRWAPRTLVRRLVGRRHANYVL